MSRLPRVSGREVVAALGKIGYEVVTTDSLNEDTAGLRSRVVKLERRVRHLPHPPKRPG